MPDHRNAQETTPGNRRRGGIQRPQPAQIPYPDLIRAADVVVTKPGYGIVSEAILNDTAVLYTDRGNFREQPLLEEALRLYTRSLKLDHQSLLDGSWAPYLESLMAQPRPEKEISAGGEVVAAERLAGFCL